MAIRQFIVFEVGGSRYGAPIEFVQEIVRMHPVTAVPDAPPCYEGLMNLRGKVLPVMDLRKRLGAEVKPGDKNRVLIVELEERRLAMIVDAACELLKISDEQIEPAPDLFEAAQSYVTGVTRGNNGLVIVVNLVALVATGSGASNTAANGSVGIA
jgi:purine-binding chemotaxis protein CheW